MPSFRHGDVDIAYLDEGEGDPFLLIHGFASNKNVNWVYPGWVNDLKNAGKRVIALDNRGHGESTKLYDPGSYAIRAMANDALALMDHLNLGTVDLMGYSMGARITATVTLSSPDRVRRAVLGGLGIGLVRGGGPGETVALALETPDPTSILDPVGRMFRSFADQTRSDRRALAACLRGSRGLMSEADAAVISRPILIAVGTNDDIAGSAAELKAIIPGSQVLDIPRRDHMRAVGDRVYKQGVLDFLSHPT